MRDPVSSIRSLSPSKALTFLIPSIASARTESKSSVQTIRSFRELTAYFPEKDTLASDRPPSPKPIYGRYIIDGARLRVRAKSMAAAAVTPAVASKAVRFDVKNHCQLNGFA
jgi:hypothetical protein